MQWFEDRLNDEGWGIEQHWEGSKQGTYKVNYTMKKTGAKEGIFYLGLGFNGNGREDARRLKIEFNPNKTDIPNTVYALLLDNQVRFDKVLRCDLAIDFEGMPMASFRLLPDDGRTMLKYIGTRDNLTKYLKPDNADGHLKIYDKTKERADNGIEIPNDTTRIEITINNPLNRIDLEGIITSTLSQIVYHFRMDASIPWEIKSLAKNDELTRSDILHEMPERTRRRTLSKLREISDSVNLLVDIEGIKGIVDGINGYTMENDLEGERVTYAPIEETWKDKDFKLIPDLSSARMYTTPWPYQDTPHFEEIDTEKELPF